jgi:hypothetical protein
MEENNPPPKAPVPSNRFEPPFFLILLALLFGFTMQSAMDHFLSGLNHYPTGSALWVALSKDPRRKVLLLFQFIVFIFTVIRFYIGAYRYGIESTDEPLLETVVNSVGTFLLFASFYVTSFALRDVDLFYWLVGLFLLVDFIWFFVVGAVWRARAAHHFPSVPKSMAWVIRIWQFFDFATVLIIALSMWLLPEYRAQYIAICGIGGIGLIDMFWLRRFYSSQPDWAKDTFLLKRLVHEP